ncbi:MAG: hypothetical protein KF891_16920 [Rhizobacter sp.]|nr:hypothetical protein [Rhizobacter sp.]
MDWIKHTEWRHLIGVHASRPDPYLIWAALTDWDDYRTGHVRRRPWPCRLVARLRRRWRSDLRPASGPRPKADVWRFLIIELSEVGSERRKFRKLAYKFRACIRIPSDFPQHARYVTARVTLQGLKALTRPPLADAVVRFDLCEAVMPRRAGVMANIPVDKPLRPELEGTVILGVVDDGCAFAHALFSPAIAAGLRVAAAAKSTRMAAVWDQNAGDAVPAEAYRFGHAAQGFGYGREIFRTYGERNGTKGPLLGLADALNLHLSQAAFEEQDLYDTVGLPSMRRRIVHGPHVCDVFAGPIRLRERVPEDRFTPPTWAPAKDLAADPDKSDIVFVQLPLEGLQDSSGGWLDSHILDAVSYIDRCRRDDAHKAVINVSYGNTMGPHDGSTILDRALAELVTARLGKVHLVMAGGNSFGARGHAEFKVRAGQPVTLTWRVPPGSETPHFMQLWLPKGLSTKVLKTVAITVQLPGADHPTKTVGMDQVVAWPEAGRPRAVATLLSQSSRGDGAMALLAVSRTAAGDGIDDAPAPHGDWLVSIACVHELEHVHAYIARNDRDLGATLRGRQSYFVDEVDERDRYLRRPHDDPRRDDADTALFGDARDGAQVKRRGTQNGIATGAGVEAVAGYNRAISDDPGEGVHAPYASAGWQLAENDRACALSVARPSDESSVLKGMRAAGSRSGSTYRLVGTSGAAPQQARLLANAGAPPNRQGGEQSRSPQGDEELYGKEGRQEIVSRPTTS